MIEVRGCRFPDDRACDVANHVWYQPVGPGTFRVGLTEVAVALASRQIFAVTPKRVGRPFEAGRSAATIESSKWVGPMRLAFDGVVTAVNPVLETRPAVLAADPYGEGWVIEVETPAAAPLAGLPVGPALAAAYADWMAANDFPGCG